MLPLQTFYPENDLLKKFIAYYYFLKTDSPDFETTYYAFPNTLQPLNIHKHARCTINDHTVLTEGDPNNKYLKIVQGRTEKPLFVQLKGILDKITILFKPLGLNQFIKVSFCEVANEPLQLFNEWNNDKNYNLFLESFFNTSDNNQRVKILESFLLSIYSPFKEQEILQKSIDLLSDFHEELSINTIANSVGLNNRTFNRVFQKHVGISPVRFRKIARFRHSLKNKLFNGKFKKLTEIGYESNFYDQSYFIKIYNNLAGINPKAFFKSIDKLADDNLIFQFIKK